MSTSELTTALADFFAATWPADSAPVEPSTLGASGWPAFTELGLHLVGVPEEQGGSGGSFADLVALATLGGRHAVAIPLVEATTAAWAVARTGASVDADSTYTLALNAQLALGADGTVSGVLSRVPWGAQADVVVTVVDGRTVALDPAHAEVRHDADLAGQPLDTLALDAVTPLFVAEGASRTEIGSRAAVVRLGMIAGALQGTSELTRRYVSERVQFGKPIGSFQGVQAHVVAIEQMAVMTTALADRLAGEGALRVFDVAAARLVAAENAEVAAAAAHQAHGAIGMTREYRLHTFTRRLHAWAGDHGEPIDLAGSLGAAATRTSFAGLILDEHDVLDPRETSA